MRTNLISGYGDFTQRYSQVERYKIDDVIIYHGTAIDLMNLKTAENMEFISVKACFIRKTEGEGGQALDNVLKNWILYGTKYNQ